MTISCCRDSSSIVRLCFLPGHAEETSRANVLSASGLRCSPLLAECSRHCPVHRPHRPLALLEQTRPCVGAHDMECPDPLAPVASRAYAAVAEIQSQQVGVTLRRFGPGGRPLAAWAGYALRSSRMIKPIPERGSRNTGRYADRAQASALLYEFKRAQSGVAIVHIISVSSATDKMANRDLQFVPRVGFEPTLYAV